jgi:hypothetical protein
MSDEEVQNHLFPAESLPESTKMIRGKRHASGVKSLPAPTRSMKLQAHRARPLVCIAIFPLAKQGIHRVESGPLQMRDK